MSRLKDESWVAAYTAAATELDATFGDSSGTTAWLKCDGVNGIQYALTNLTFVAATKIYVTPKFRDKAQTVTYATYPDGSPLVWELDADDRQTAIYGPIDAYEVSCELWIDATDAGAVATVNMRRAVLEV